MSADQTAQVLALLRERGASGITALDALDIVGSMRLSARIYDLKAQGYRISMSRETTATGKRIGRYRLAGERERIIPAAPAVFVLPPPEPPVTSMVGRCPKCDAPVTLRPSLAPGTLVGRCGRDGREVVRSIR